VPAPAALDGARKTLRLWLLTAGRLIVNQGQAEWFGSPPHAMQLSRPRATGFSAQPHDARPPSKALGDALLTGVYHLAGEMLQVEPGGDPFDRPSPNRAFAEALHGFEWLGDLLTVGEAGEQAGLRLVLDWRRTFGKWSPFAWTGRVLERRTVAFACALTPISTRASESECLALADLLARQGRQLLLVRAGPAREAERATAAALAGTALSGAAGDKLMARALDRLSAALPKTVLPDGGHASRSPEAGLDLLLDLLALDDGLSQRGQAPPEAMAGAIARLTAALRMFVLPDGCLALFQGGGPGRPFDVAAALSAAAPEERPSALPQAGYQRLDGRALTVMVDTGAPAEGPWSETACAQPLAIEVACGVDRLITNCGWTPTDGAPQAMRLTSAASTVSVGEVSAGSPLSGLPARALGARLEGGASDVSARRQDSPEGLWLEASQDGWVAAFGLRHERLLYMDHRIDELRGEDRLIPVEGASGPPRVLSIAIRFHLGPEIKASLARDHRSVLLQGSSTAGWWLRNDAAEVAIEHGVHYEGGQVRRSMQVVLRGQIPSTGGARIRWKLAAVGPAGS